MATVDPDGSKKVFQSPPCYWENGELRVDFTHQFSNTHDDSDSDSDTPESTNETTTTDSDNDPPQTKKGALTETTRDSVTIVANREPTRRRLGRKCKREIDYRE